MELEHSDHTVQAYSLIFSCFLASSQIFMTIYIKTQKISGKKMLIILRCKGGILSAFCCL